MSRDLNDVRRQVVSWSSPGRFRSHVAHRTQELWRSGVISAQERDALRDAAEETDIGRA